jgi:glucoamylase
MVHWSFDNWRTPQDINTGDTGLGTCVADLPTDRSSAGSEIVFTFYWLEEQRWEGTDYSVTVER